MFLLLASDNNNRSDNNNNNKNDTTYVIVQDACSVSDTIETRTLAFYLGGGWWGQTPLFETLSLKTK